MYWEEEKIRKMLKLARFNNGKKDILQLLKKAKQDEISQGGIFGIWLSMDEELDKEERKIIYPEERKK